MSVERAGRGERAVERRSVRGAARDRSGRAGGDRAGASPTCSRSSSSSRSTRVEELCDELAARVRARRAAASCSPQVAGGYRFQTHPDLARLRRAVRARGPARAPVGAGARDARDRRLQAADLARPDLGDPRRQRRGDAQHAGAARLRRRRSGATPAPAPRCSTAPPASSSSGSASTRSTTSRRSATSCPTPSVVEALERGLRVSDDPQEPDRAGRRRGRGGRRRHPASD